MAGQAYNFGGVTFQNETSGPWVPMPMAESTYQDQHIPGGDVNYVDYGGLLPKRVTWDIIIARVDETTIENMRGSRQAMSIGQDTDSDSYSNVQLTTLTNKRVTRDRVAVGYTATFTFGE